jgi:hypothetical protein
MTSEVPITNNFCSYFRQGVYDVKNFVFSDVFIPAIRPVTRAMVKARFVGKINGNPKTIFLGEGYALAELIKQGTFIGKYFTNNTNFAVNIWNGYDGSVQHS